MNTYGTDKSDFLQQIIAAGFRPIYITVMICEETFVFATQEECDQAFAHFQHTNEGWWYSLDDPKYPWEQTLKEYAESVGYQPKVYTIKY